MYEQNLAEAEENVSMSSDTTVSRLRIFGVVLLGIVLIGFICQLSIQGWFNGKVANGVTVGKIDIGGLTLDQARQKLNAAEAKLNPSFVVAGKRYTPTLAEIGAYFDTEEVLRRAYREGREGLLVHPKNSDLGLRPVVDSDRLAAYLAPITQIGTSAEDARIEVQRGVIQVVPEKAGFSIDKTVLKTAVLTKLTSFQSQEPVISPQVITASIRAPDLADAQNQAQAFIATEVTLSEGTLLIAPTKSEKANWLSFNIDATTNKMTTVIDPAKVASYVAVLAKRLDLLPTDQKLSIVNGVSKVIIEGKEGAGIDREPIVSALSRLVAGQPLAIAITRHPIPFRTFSESLTAIYPGKYIEINLSKQRLWAWDNYSVVYESPVTTGATGAGFATVVGNFKVYAKERNRFLTGADYNVYVKYWMPFYGNYGMHDASWRNGKFGGQDYYYNGSHGCVNMPEATAIWLYNWADIGTTVYVHK